MSNFEPFITNILHIVIFVYIINHLFLKVHNNCSQVIRLQVEMHIGKLIHDNASIFFAPVFCYRLYLYDVRHKCGVFCCANLVFVI